MGYDHTRRRTVEAIGSLAFGTSLVGCVNIDGSTDGGNDTSGTDTSRNDTNGDSTGGGGTGGDVNGTIEMTDALEFEPAELNVDVGGTVVWENVGSVTHTVTAFENRIPADATYFASGGADSERAARTSFPPRGGIDGGESYEHTFETTGTYEYFCISHEGKGMTGTISVFNKSGGDAGCIDYPC